MTTHGPPCPSPRISKRQSKVSGVCGSRLIRTNTRSTPPLSEIVVPGTGSVRSKLKAGMSRGGGSPEPPPPATAAPIPPAITAPPMRAHFALDPPPPGRISWAGTTPFGLKPDGTGGTAGAPGGTDTAIFSPGDDTESAVVHPAGSETRTLAGGVATISAAAEVITIRYSNCPRPLRGRGRTAVHLPPASLMRTEYHSLPVSTRNCSSADATSAAGDPAADTRA